MCYLMVSLTKACPQLRSALSLDQMREADSEILRTGGHYQQKQPIQNSTPKEQRNTTEWRTSARQYVQISLLNCYIVL